MVELDRNAKLQNNLTFLFQQTIIRQCRISLIKAGNQGTSLYVTPFIYCFIFLQKVRQKNPSQMSVKMLDITWLIETPVCLFFPHYVRILARSFFKMSSHNPLLRLEQRAAEADQLIEYLKQQVQLLKEKASKTQTHTSL